jgi:hypothetical protein
MQHFFFFKETEEDAHDLYLIYILRLLIFFVQDESRMKKKMDTQLSLSKSTGGASTKVTRGTADFAADIR